MYNINIVVMPGEDTWNVLLPDKIHGVGPEYIKDFVSFTSVSEYGKSESELIPHIQKYDAVILRTAELTEKVINKADNLKIIAKHGAGLDNVDINVASENNIVVCNTPGMNSRAVAEHAVTLIMATRRNLLLADKNVRYGEWAKTRSDWERFRRSEIHGDVLGLLAFGSIAREVANIALGLGMECVTYDPYISDEDLPSGINRVDNQTELFERSDVVSVHVPLTEETHHSIGINEFRALGPDGIIINTARGGVIDENDLITALRERVIMGAGLDVLEQEPPSENNPLLKSKKTIITPHCGGISLEATYNMSLEASKNVKKVYEGELPDSTINGDKINVHLG